MRVVQRCVEVCRGADLEREEEVRERRVVVARESEHLLLAPAAHRGWHAAFARAAKGAVGRRVVQRRLGRLRRRAAVGARRRLGLLGDGGRAAALLLLGLLGQASGGHGGRAKDLGLAPAVVPQHGVIIEARCLERRLRLGGALLRLLRRRLRTGTR